VRMVGHLFVFTRPLILARLAITLSGWEFLQLFGVDRDYQVARSAFAASGKTDMGEYDGKTEERPFDWRDR